MRNSAPILERRTLSEYISLLLRADAKSYTTASEFAERNSTFLSTKINRPPYIPASSSTSPTSLGLQTVPMSAIHTAAAALTLVPSSHWTIETHRFNINSYDGSNAVTVSSGAYNAPVAKDKLFKKELYHYLRWALSASAPGPGIPETMAILGRAESVRRIENARALTLDLVQNTASRHVPRLTKGVGNEDRGWMGSLAFSH